MTHQDHRPDEVIASAAIVAIERLNEMAREVFRTRGGRIGSGMGLLLEGLWGYHVNAVLRERSASVELAWLGDHQYNDFVAADISQPWNPATQEGEFLRIEAKSMIRSADESKAHFDAVGTQMGELDLLVVLVWDWVLIDDVRYSPQILDFYIGNARALAAFRDALHVARGGSFVTVGKCPDKCGKQCAHVGEPLNAAGKRERSSGPKAARVSANVSFAANFGGLTRMIAAGSVSAKNAREAYCKANPEAKRYVDFIRRQS